MNLGSLIKLLIERRCLSNLCSSYMPIGMPAEMKQGKVVDMITSHTNVHNWPKDNTEND